MVLTEKELALLILEELNRAYHWNVAAALQRVAKKATPNYKHEYNSESGLFDLKVLVFHVATEPTPVFASGTCGRCGDFLFDDNTTDCSCDRMEG